MVSRRNYITITIMLLILFFMFQFTGVVKERWNDYRSNPYAEVHTAFTKQDVWKAEENGQPDIVYAGSSPLIRQVVSSYATGKKQTLVCKDSLETCGTLDADCLLIVDDTSVTDDTAIRQVKTYADVGVTIVFASMPSFELMEKSALLRNLTGVYQAYEKQVKLQGMHLFSGFLLGGEALYEVQIPEEKERQDLDLTIPWYITGSGTETYMVGTLPDATYNQAVKSGIAQSYLNVGTDENSTKNSLLPAVLWRNRVGDANVFCVNGDFLKDDSGIGILSAFVTENSTYTLDAIVNAQNLVVADYPAFVSENESEFQKRYSQSADAVYQDILWPSIASLAKKTNRRITCMMTPQFSYSDALVPDGTNVSYYLKLLNEQQAEAGLSGVSAENRPVVEKLKEDAAFWDTYASSYVFQSLYVRDTAGLRELYKEQQPALRTTVVGTESGSAPAFGYATDSMTVQYATDTGVTHTFSDDLKLRSRETAYGYSNIALDLYCVTYPQSDDDSWQNLSKKVAANVATYWAPFDAFEKTTLTESDARIRRFLALDYTTERTGNTITLSLKQWEEEAFFLLRLHGEEVVSVEGGSVQQFETGSYLLTAEAETVTITVKETEKW